VKKPKKLRRVISAFVSLRSTKLLTSPHHYRQQTRLAPGGITHASLKRLSRLCKAQKILLRNLDFLPQCYWLKNFLTMEVGQRQLKSKVADKLKLHANCKHRKHCVAGTFCLFSLRIVAPCFRFFANIFEKKHLLPL